MNDESVIKKILKIEKCIKRKFDKLADSTGINGTEGRVIHFLILNQDRDIFQKDVEIEFDFRPSTASELLKKMESKGYILREVSKTDARLKKLTLTDKAKEHEERIINDIVSLEEYIQKGISPKDLETYDRISNIILENIKNFRND